MIRTGEYFIDGELVLYEKMHAAWNDSILMVSYWAPKGANHLRLLMVFMEKDQ